MLGLVATAGTALGGCTSTPVGLPAGVEVSLTQFRDDYGRRVVQIVVDDGADVPLTLTRVTLTASGFAGESARDRRVEIPAGSTRDLPVVLGAPDCAVEPVASRVTLEFEDAAGRSGRASRVPADPLGVLADAHRADCLVEAVATAARIEPVRFRVEGAGADAVGVLDFDVVPSGADASLLLERIDRTILLKPADGTSSWAVDREVRGGDAPFSIELRLVPSNCNPHLLAEDKRGTFWPLDVRFDDGSTGTAYVPTGTALRAQLYGFMAGYCGWPGGR